MLTSERDLYTDNHFTKTLIVTYTPKKKCYGYIIVVSVLTVYMKNVSIICQCIFLLFNFDHL